MGKGQPLEILDCQTAVLKDVGESLEPEFDTARHQVAL